MDVTFIVELDCLLEIAFQVGTVSVVNPSNINILDIIISTAHAFAAKKLKKQFSLQIKESPILITVSLNIAKKCQDAPEVKCRKISWNRISQQFRLRLLCNILIKCIRHMFYQQLIILDFESKCSYWWQAQKIVMD